MEMLSLILNRGVWQQIYYLEITIENITIEFSGDAYFGSFVQ